MIGWLELRYSPEDRRYFVRNTWTGVFLSNPKTDEVKAFRTQWGASRYARKVEREFNSMFRKVKK